MALSKKKSCKVWIWKALCRRTGRLLDWELGNRDLATLQPLVDRLSRWNVVVYLADHWECYASLLGVRQLMQGKIYTNTIERNNARQRHWFKRFTRRTQVVSQSLEMIDLTMGLFASLHVNGNADQLLSLIR